MRDQQNRGTHWALLWGLVAGLGTASGCDPSPTPMDLPTATPMGTESASHKMTDRCGTGTYQAQVTKEGPNYVAFHDSETIYTGSNFSTAVQLAIDQLTPERTSMERVLVRPAGTLLDGQQITLRSHTGVDFCGTIHVEAPSHVAPIYAQGVEHVEIGHLAMTGSPHYAVLLRDVQHTHLGTLNLQLTDGHGLRIHSSTNRHAERPLPTSHIVIDNMYISGSSSHGLELDHVNGVFLGTLTARNTRGSGLFLKNTAHVYVDHVDAHDTGSAPGHAAVTLTNRSGRIGNAYPQNLYFKQVVARGGAGGISCTSESGGADFGVLDLTVTGAHPILVENCQRIRIGTESGLITGGGDVRVSASQEFASTSDVVLQNLTITNTDLVESPCGDNTVIQNVRVTGGRMSICAGSDQGENSVN